MIYSAGYSFSVNIITTIILSLVIMYYFHIRLIYLIHYLNSITCNYKTNLHQAN